MRAFEIHADEEITVDGDFWGHCIFQRCKLTRNDPETKLWGAYYEDCVFKGKGWPVSWRRRSRSEKRFRDTINKVLTASIGSPQS